MVTASSFRVVKLTIITLKEYGTDDLFFSPHTYTTLVLKRSKTVFLETMIQCRDLGPLYVFSHTGSIALAVVGFWCLATIMLVSVLAEQSHHCDVCFSVY